MLAGTLLHFSDSDTSVWRNTVWYYSSRCLTNFASRYYGGPRGKRLIFHLMNTVASVCNAYVVFFFWNFGGHDGFENRGESRVSLCRRGSVIDDRKLRFKKLGNIEADTKRKIGSSTYRVIFRLLVQYYIILKS